MLILDSRSRRAELPSPPSKSNLRNFAGRWRSAMLGACLFLLGSGPALADLMLFPTRIVLDQNQRSANLELINNGLEVETYRIHVVNRRMSETGDISEADPPLPGEQFADSMLRYTPRQIVLAPGRSQTVRVMVRRPADLSTGEYRSHLLIDRVPDMTAVNSIESQSAGSEAGKMGVQLKALIGVSIPVIVRQGATEATVTLGELQLMKPVHEGPAVLAMVMRRSGNRSVYGDLSATFTPRGGTPIEVANAGGVAVYTPNALRRVKLEAHPPAGRALERGTLRVTFRERPEAGSKLLAESFIEVP